MDELDGDAADDGVPLAQADSASTHATSHVA
jgi:hypothetical protein